MKATIPHKDLKDALNRINQATGPSQHLPALEGVVLGVTEGVVTLARTDLEVTVWAELHNAVDRLNVDGAALLPFKTLRALVGKLDGDTVTLATDDEGRINVLSGDADIELRPLFLDDYPALPVPAATADVSTLVPHLPALVSAASSDGARPVLTSVHFEPGAVVTTDSFRLCMVEADTGGLAALVPSRLVKAITQAKPKTLQAGKAEGDEGDVTFYAPGDAVSLTWVVRQVYGRFPDFRQLIPTSHEGTVTVERARTVKAIDRIAAIAEGIKTSSPISLHPNGTVMRITAGNGERGTAAEKVPGVTEGTVPELVAFNPKMLAEGLNAFDADAVTIRFRDELKPAVMVAEGSPVLWLQMPVRL